MNSILLTKSKQFLPLTGYLAGHGVPIGRYIERFRIPKGLLDTPELYIDESRFWRLAGDLAKREGCLDWGFRAGQQLDLSVLGEFGDTLLRQPSLKAALERFLATIRVEALHVDFELMPQLEYFWFLQRGYRNAPSGRSVVELYNLQFMIKLVQSSVGHHWRPPAVHLQCRSLPDGMAAGEICAGAIRFSSTMTAIAIPRALMVTPMSDYQEFPVIGGAIECVDQAQIDFAASLRLLLAGYIDEGLTIGDCADLVGMSDRTLQRRLAEHKTSFNEILDQTRFDIARRLLQDESISMSSIAYDLGYANPANFTRAFRRWAGVSPREHRQWLYHLK